MTVRASPGVRVKVRVAATGRVLARAELAATPLRRLRGLLGRDGLAAGDGLVIDPCSSVHTCFMRFPIDLLFIDRDGRVLRAAENVGPFRFVSGGRGARRTIELPAGTIANAKVAPGATLALDPA
ncbi:MAG: hypothetical protein A3H96_15980 [Acidobacteria bacterium RIFCSPLOWO2_02_FULL_67_36]|nr:MAG: hypothetical protein A3H96_15980 [Acidobacteria bacterium RIFCSPLOWO2_02_FULL_67_36]OFW21217.1 MAG: hypothetical protein A3G21_11195 [Acidobacteria bacterium RIFCSPLOWO2_12_FULL_66_21]